MKLIVAVCQDWGIGKDGDQPFYIPEDLQYFKAKTLGKVMVMGRITLAALPNGPLKRRTNIVLTRDAGFSVEGAATCNSLDELLHHLSQYDTDDVFVIGGQQIYEQLLPYCDTAYVTKIFATAPTDRFFPNLDDMDNWQLHSQSEIKSHDGIDFSFCEYRNIVNTPLA